MENKSNIEPKELVVFKDELQNFEWQDFFPESLTFKNTVQLVPKQELFCQEYTANNQNGALAYFNSYHPQNRSLDNNEDRKYLSTKASQLLKQNKIQVKIQEIQEQIQDKFNYTRERSIKKLLVIQKTAMANVNQEKIVNKDGNVIKYADAKMLTVAKDCEKTIASILGFADEKIENNQNNNILINISKE